MCLCSSLGIPPRCTSPSWQHAAKQNHEYARKHNQFMSGYTHVMCGAEEKGGLKVAAIATEQICQQLEVKFWCIKIEWRTSRKILLELPFSPSLSALTFTYPNLKFVRSPHMSHADWLEINSDRMVTFALWQHTFLTENLYFYITR